MDEKIRNLTDRIVDLQTSVSATEKRIEEIDSCIEAYQAERDSLTKSMENAKKMIRGFRNLLYEAMLAADDNGIT